MQKNPPDLHSHLAPPRVMARYLAVFERSLQFIKRAGERLDRDEMLLGGYLADTLHNVPAFLTRYECDEWHRAERFASTLAYAPEEPECNGAPPRIVEACRRLFTADLQPGELGLDPDLQDLCLAPPARLAAYLEFLYNVCLTVRLIRNYGFPRDRSDEPPCFWNTSDENWQPKGEEAGRHNHLLAAIALPTPQGLLNWKRFNEAQFLEHAERLWTIHRGESDWREHGKRMLSGISETAP
jgi:hypothetical protein